MYFLSNLYAVIKSQRTKCTSIQCVVILFKRGGMEIILAEVAQPKFKTLKINKYTRKRPRERRPATKMSEGDNKSSFAMSAHPGHSTQLVTRLTPRGPDCSIGCPAQSPIPVLCLNYMLSTRRDDVTTVKRSNKVDVLSGLVTGLY